MAGLTAAVDAQLPNAVHALFMGLPATAASVLGGLDPASLARRSNVWACRTSSCCNLGIDSLVCYLFILPLLCMQIDRVGLPQQHLFFEKGKMRVGPLPLAPPESKNEYFYADA